MSYFGDRVAAGSGSVTKVAPSTTAACVLKANPERSALKFYNNSDQAVYIGYLSASNAGAQMSYSDRFSNRIASASFYEEPRPYYGPVSVVWAVSPSTGSLYITELS